MAKQKSRVFLGNLPVETTEKEIKQKLAKYGEVSSIEIKQKKESDNVTVASTFAYVDLDADRLAVQQCLQDLRAKDWNGSWIKAELAKESFLQRLQREREENAKAASSENRKINVSNDCLNKPEKVKTSLPNKDIFSKRNNEIIKPEKVKDIAMEGNDIALKRRKISFKNDDDSDDNSSCEENLVSKLESFSDLWKDDEPVRPARPLKQLRNERNQNFSKKDVPSLAKLPSFPSSVKSDLPEKESNPAAKAGELKRLKAMEEKNKALKQQKDAIKNALSSIDVVKSSKKIVFDDDGEPVSNTLPSSFKHTPISKEQRNGYHKTSSAPQLFGGEDDEADNWQGDFTHKKQFEGKKGRKLLEMQSRIKDDERFVFNERFYESDEEADDTNKATEPPATVEEKDLQEEKAKEMEILSNILGAPVQPSTHKKSTFNPMVRFDPLKPNHAKFELPKAKDTQEKADLDGKGKSDVADKKDRIEDEPLPVDEKQFYQVSSNIRDLFKKEDKKVETNGSSTFSLRQMFAPSADDDEKEKKEEDDDSNKRPVKIDQPKPKEDSKTFLRGFQESKPLAMFSKKLLRPEPEGGGNTFCKDVNVEAIAEKFSQKRRILGRMLHKKKIRLEREQHFKQKIGVASA